MKSLFALVILQAAFAPSLSWALDEKKADPVSVCKEKASFAYQFDMMKIEGEEIRGKIGHDFAGERKLSRHEEYLSQLSDCE